MVSCLACSDLFVSLFNTPRLKPSLGLFIFGCISSCDQYLGMFYANKNKTRLIQIPATLPNMFYAKDKACTQKAPKTPRTYQLLHLRETNTITLRQWFCICCVAISRGLPKVCMWGCMLAFEWRPQQLCGFHWHGKKRILNFFQFN